MFRLIKLIICATLLGVSGTIYFYEGGITSFINIITFSLLTTSWTFLVLAK